MNRDRHDPQSVNVSYKLSLTADDMGTLPQGDYDLVVQYTATTNQPTSTDRTTQEMQEGGGDAPPFRLSLFTASHGFLKRASQIPHTEVLGCSCSSES